MLFHDSTIILDVTDEFCDLFRCARDKAIGLPILDLLLLEDYKGLGRLRMRVLREKGKVPPVFYLFRRFDGSAFYGEATTEKEEDGRYRSTIVHQSEE